MAFNCGFKTIPYAVVAMFPLRVITDFLKGNYPDDNDGDEYLSRFVTVDRCYMKHIYIYIYILWY